LIGQAQLGLDALEAEALAYEALKVLADLRWQTVLADRREASRIVSSVPPIVLDGDARWLAELGH